MRAQPDASLESDEARRSRVLGIFVKALLGMVVFAELASLLDVLFFHWDPTSVTFLPIGGLFFFILLGLELIRRRVSWLLAANVFLVFCVVAALFADAPVEVTEGRSLFFFTLPILMSSFIISPRYSFATAGLVSLGVGLMGWLALGRINLFAIPSFFGFATLAWVGAQTWETALERLRALNLQLDQLVTIRTQELAEANANLRASLGKLEELDAIKSKFVADVSHELRSPLAAVRMFLAQIQREPGAMNGDAAFVLSRETDRLNTLVQDILELSQLEAEIRSHAAETRFQAVALETLVQEAIASAALEAQVKGVALETDLAPARPVWGHPGQLKQVVINLITNALHYTPTGYVLVRTLSGNGETWLEVEDTGVGIAPEDLPHIFTRFYRGRRTASMPGTGLGLAIVKEIIDVHHGQISVTSTPGAGTTMRVCLPVAPLEAV